MGDVVQKNRDGVCRFTGGPLGSYYTFGLSAASPFRAKEPLNHQGTEANSILR